MPIRVLQIVTILNRGGLETMLMNYYRHIDRNKVQFDFLVHRPDEGDYEKEILSLGGRIYRVPPMNPFLPAYYKALDKFFTEHKYDVVHSHLDCMSAYPLMVAKKHGVKQRFAHAHNISQDKDLKYPIKLMSRHLISQFATGLFACSEEAGNWMFSGKQFTVINNAIDAIKYIFSEQEYYDKRKKLSLGDELAVCHVGRFSPQKNHDFLIDVFYELLKIKPDSKLLLIGEGSGKETIHQKVKALNIETQVSFLGLRDDVNEILKAVDIFLFPSLFEGLGIAAVEAQAAGLPCILSDKVPTECKMIDSVEFVSLEDSLENWVNKILKYDNYIRKNEYYSICDKGYDISSKAEWLESFYLKKGSTDNE